MAGQRPTLTQELRDFHQNITVYLNGDQPQYIPIYTALRRTVVEGFVVRMDELDATAAGGSNTITFSRVSSGTAPSGATAMTDALGIGALNSTVDTNLIPTFVDDTLGVPTQNILEAGQSLYGVLAAAFDPDTASGGYQAEFFPRGVITIRISTAIK